MASEMILSHMQDEGEKTVEGDKKKNKKEKKEKKKKEKAEKAAADKAEKAEKAASTSCHRRTQSCVQTFTVGLNVLDRDEKHINDTVNVSVWSLSLFPLSCLPSQPHIRWQKPSSSSFSPLFQQMSNQQMESRGVAIKVSLKEHCVTWVLSLVLTPYGRPAPPPFHFLATA